MCEWRGRVDLCCSPHSCALRIAAAAACWAPAVRQALGPWPRATRPCLRHHAAERNADLLWASCGGGGGTFGVVAQLELRISTLPEGGRVTAVEVRSGGARVHTAGGGEQGSRLRTRCRAAAAAEAAAWVHRKGFWLSP